MTTIIGTMSTELDHRTSQIRTNLEIVEVSSSNNDFSRSPSTSKHESSFTDFRNQPRSNSPNTSVSNRFGKRDPSNNIPYDKKFPTSNNGNQPNVVRFPTTHNEINELSGLCPLNY